jgi:hypothetical protein
MTLERSKPLERFKTDVGGPGLPPVDEDDDSDDDGGEWSDWSWLNQTFGAKLRKWIESSPVVGKIAEIIYERTFSGEPRVILQGFFKRTNQPPWSGQFWTNFIWDYPEDFGRVYGEVLALFRRSDLYKVFDKQPNELWETLNKGDVSEWVFQEVMFGITGQHSYTRPITYKRGLFHFYYIFKQNSDRYKEMIEKKINRSPLHIDMGKPEGFFSTFKAGGGFSAGGSVLCKYESGGFLDN